MSTGFVKALGRIGHVLTTYNVCLNSSGNTNLFFTSSSGGTNMLSVGSVSGVGYITSYVIDWHLNSSTGTTVLVSGYNPNPEDIVDVLHPFTNQTVIGGYLYAVIRYIVIDGIKYSPFFRVGQYSPDLIPEEIVLPSTGSTCLGYVKVYVPPEVDCLDGLTIETTYLNTTGDLALLPSGYTNPCGVGGHSCDRAFFEIYGNGVYIGDSKLNNTSTALVGCQSLSGSYILGDYHNYPDAFTAPVSWLASGGSPGARYNKIVLTRQQAINIAAAGSGTTITFSLIPGVVTYSCGSTSYHGSVTWTRITKSDGLILWNSCIDGNNVKTINICTTGSTSGTTTTTTSTTLPPTTTTTTTCIGINCRYIFENYGGGKIISISGNSALIVLPQYNWPAGAIGFNNWDSAISSASTLTYSGYSDWRLPSVAEWKIIGFVPGAATQMNWNQYTYYWTSDMIDSTHAYRWRTSDDSCGMYGETYNIETSTLKSSIGLYGIAVRTEYF